MRRTIPALCLLLAVSVAACGDSGDEDSPAATTTNGDETLGEGVEGDEDSGGGLLPELVPAEALACDPALTEVVESVTGHPVADVDDQDGCEYFFADISQRVYLRVGASAGGSFTERDALAGALDEPDAVAVEVGTLAVYVPTFQTTYFHQDGRYGGVGINGAPLDQAQEWTTGIAAALVAAWTP